MTTVPAATTNTPATSAPTTSATDPMQQLSGNFDTFLQLLTTQLQNQDPMDPMDSNEFTQQLVEYSQVEQQIDTNSNLQNLITLTQGNSASGAVSYLGKNVSITNGNGALSDGEAAWTYNLASPSSATMLTVTNSSGTVVYSGAGSTTAGANSFEWDGEDNNGNQMPDGVYTLSAAAQASDGTTIQTSVSSSGTVTGIDTTGATPQLLIGPMEIPMSAVAGVQSASN